MVNKLLTAYLGKSDENDRDHYGKKRVDTAGNLLLTMFKDKFINHYLNYAQRILQKMFNDGKNIDGQTRI